MKDNYNSRDYKDYKIFETFIKSMSNRYHTVKMQDGCYIDAQMSAMTRDLAEAIDTFDIEIKVRDKYHVFKDGILLECWKYDKLKEFPNRHKWYVNYFPKDKMLLIIDMLGVSEKELEEWRDDERYKLPKSTIENKGRKYKQVYYIPTDRFSGFTFNYDEG